MYAQTPRESNDSGQDKDSGEGPRCKYCEGDHLIKWGKQNGHQRYQCKDCHRVFDDNGKLPRAQMDLEVVGTALYLCFEGLSLRKIQAYLRRKHGINVAFRTILYWIERHVPIVEKFTNALEPELSGVWHADETVLMFQHDTPCPVDGRGRKVRRPGAPHYFWDCIDEGTRFLVGAHLSKDRTKEDGIQFFRDCKIAGGRPKTIFTDHLQGYPRFIRKVFFTQNWSKKVEHVATGAIPNTKIRIHQQLIERFHGTLDDRVNVMRGLKSPDTAVLRGFRIHYNFLRAHGSLGGATPAEAAGIQLPFEDGWGDLIRWAHHFDRGNWGNEEGYVEIEFVPT